MAYGDFARTDYDEKCYSEERVQHLEERDRILGARPFAAHFLEQSRSAASWASVHTFDTIVPDYAAGWYLHAQLQIKVAAGTGGQIRLRDNTAGLDGTAQTGVANTSYDWSDDLSVLVASVAHTEISVSVQLQGDGTNNMFVQGGTATHEFLTWRWSRA